MSKSFSDFSLSDYIGNGTQPQKRGQFVQAMERKDAPKYDKLSKTEKT